MTCRTSLTLSVASLCLVLTSCSKHGTNGNTTTTTTNTPSLNMSFYPSFYGPQTEVIVSEPGGKILLDTVATNTGIPLTASLQTTDTLVDVTDICPIQGGPSISIFTFKSVNLARLTTLTINGFGNIYKRQTNNTTSQIVYYNIPSQVNLSNFDFFFANYPINGLTGMQGDQANHTLQVGFNNYSGNYAYVLFPQEGLYNLHMQQNATDSVDCSHLDTAVLLTFSRPVPFTANSSYNALYGVFDTTDLSRAIAFTDYVQLQRHVRQSKTRLLQCPSRG